MSDPIFTKISVTKQQIYQKICDLLTGAGWVNISSKPSVDGDIFSSAGETGDKALLIRLSQGSSPIGSTSSPFFCASLPYSYTPGAAGVSGTFDSRRTSDSSYRNLYVTNTTPTVGLDAVYDMYYTVNKNRIIFVLDPKCNRGDTARLHFIGLPDDAIGNETLNNGSIILSTYQNGYFVDGSYLVGVCNPPKSFSVGMYQLNIYVLMNTLEGSPDGSMVLSRVGYGSSVEGLRGMAEGVYIIRGVSFNDYYIVERARYGDTFTSKDGTKKYLLFSVYGYNTSLPSQGDANHGLARTYFAIRVQ